MWGHLHTKGLLPVANGDSFNHRARQEPEQVSFDLAYPLIQLSLSYSVTTEPQGLKPWGNATYSHPSLASHQLATVLTKLLGKEGGSKHEEEKELPVRWHTHLEPKVLRCC